MSLRGSASDRSNPLLREGDCFACGSQRHLKSDFKKALYYYFRHIDNTIQYCNNRDTRGQNIYIGASEKCVQMFLKMYTLVHVGRSSPRFCCNDFSRSKSDKSLTTNRWRICARQYWRDVIPLERHQDGVNDSEIPYCAILEIPGTCNSQTKSQ